MLVIVGLIVLLAAGAVAVTGVLTNAGATHLLTDHFAVLGYHITGSTGTLFLYGVVVGAVAGVGLSVLLTGARRAVNRGRDARHDLQTCQHDTASVDHDLDTQFKDHPHVGADASAPGNVKEATPGAERFGLLGDWWRRLKEGQHQAGAEPTSKTESTKQ